jgi:hypothetical protein
MMTDPVESSSSILGAKVLAFAGTETVKLTLPGPELKE